ncbi:hypothetical protein LTR08_000737 [Meristemomyces frigidus]|nr:hypothetical protein LTR08_000737 [Meristemomyces frigidus]
MDDSSPVQATGSPAVDMLTPRSKVAKMLADIDNAPTPSPPTRLVSKDAALRSSHAEERASSPARGNANGKPSSRDTSGQRVNGPFQVESASESDDEDLNAVRRPQGRGAKRMLGQLQSSPRSGSDHPLQASPSPAERHPATMGLEDDEEDLYSATPLKARPAVVSNSGSPLGSDRGGLFVSPAKSNENVSDDELPSIKFSSKEKLAQLVTQKREERLRREAEEQRGKRFSKKRKHLSSPSSPHASSDLPDEVLEDSQAAPNPEIERIMSDAARPTRKASKRALLEMERETQRLSRQQALAHQMKVKKKFTTSDLMARFSTRRSSPLKEIMGSSSAPNSDGVEMTPRKLISTPPSSPPTAGPTPLDKQKEIVERGALSKLVPVREDSIASLAQLDSDDELPDIAEVMGSAREANVAIVQRAAVPAEHQAMEKRGLKLARFGKSAVTRRHDDSGDDDDDGLDIVAPMPKHLQMFDKVRSHTNTNGTTAADNKAIHTLKHLAHIGAYEGMPRNRTGKNASRPSIGPKTLEKQLRLRAKEQAKLQMEERIGELRAKGVIIQTEEEREREAEGLEDLLERGRREAEGVRKAERAEAKKEGKEGDASEDESEDGDYLGSGSEVEDDLVEGDDGGMIDGAAEESDDDEVEEENVEDMDDVEELATGAEQQDSLLEVREEPNPETPALAARKPRQSRIIRDDSDEDSDLDLPPHTNNNLIEDDAAADPFAAFNFGANAYSDALMSPTQAFQATMQTPSQATQEESFDILRRIAPPSAQSALPPTFPPTFDEETQEEVESQVSMVPGSQVPESQQIFLGWETQQAPETPAPAGLTRGVSGLSETPGWEPTQDAGMPSPWTLGPQSRKQDVEEHDTTQETVRLRISESPAAAPVAQKRGRLQRRRAGALADSSDEDDEAPPAASAKQQKRDAFREMARLRTVALTTAERAEAEREMRHMLEEQAEESEDEYAGLGGDDFVAPETEEDKAMIEDSHIDVDERALAAHYAERRRVEDEKATSKLYRDLTTGMLRKQQANAFGLEEDEDEIAARRRVMRQREEARKRKLLLKDENIAGLLGRGRDSKGKDAFLKAIADDDEGDDEMIGLSDGEGEESQTATQEESQSQSQHISQQSQPGLEAEGTLKQVSGNKRRFPEGDDKAEDRPPAKQRRTQAGAFKKPISLLEVRESVSFLLDEPDHGFAAPAAVDGQSEYESDSEDQDVPSEEDDLDEMERSRQNDGGFAPNSIAFDAQAMPPPPPRLPASQRRTVVKPTVVDRLSLKRDSSSSSDASTRSAWAAPLTSGAGAFKTPSLLRRATTTNVSANDRGVSTPVRLAREGSSSSGVRMGGSKKSSLAYQARAEERRAIVEAGARRRDENTKRIAEMRRNSSALGRGLTGRFEE